jgi:hypothetical protein
MAVAGFRCIAPGVPIGGTDPAQPASSAAAMLILRTLRLRNVPMLLGLPLAIDLPAYVRSLRHSGNKALFYGMA